MERSLLLLALVCALTGCEGRRAEAASLAPAHPSASAAPSPPAVSASPAPALQRGVRYPADRDQSPITDEVVASLKQIAARDPSLRSDVFAKIGDSITASADYLYCFSSHHALHHVDLADRGDLAAALDKFRAGHAAGRDPFFRESIAAVVGWSAWQMLQGIPTPLDAELDKLRPRYALVMFGTNDLEAGNPRRYADNLFDIVDRAIARGTIPILFSIPPRLDKPRRDVWVPRYNAIVRGVAMLRRIPFIDFHRALAHVPHHGLGKDGIHPSTYAGKLGFESCDFNAPALEHGYNVRNLLSLVALDRASRALERGAALDAPAPGPAGDGTTTDPFVVAALPFVDAPDVATSTYRIDVTRQQRVHVLAVAHGKAPPSLHVVRRDAPGSPLGSAKGTLAVVLDAGSYLIQVDKSAAADDTIVVISDDPRRE